MKIKRLKKLVPILIFTLSLTMLSCGIKQNSTPSTNISKIDVSNVIKYKDTYIGDNSAVSNIISNLPANTYSTKLELQTKTEPYEINIDYNLFGDIVIKFQNDTSVTSSFSDVNKKNAMILFSLIRNLDIINLNFDNGTTIIYERNDIVDHSKNKYGNNLEKITESGEALESFLKNNLN